MSYDVVVIGAGMSGMATAARLQAQGFSTLVLEVHHTVGGCCGYYHREGFSFDVGATTLVNFEEGQIGGDLLKTLNMDLKGDILEGYKAWLPDRDVHIYRDDQKWAAERLLKFGQTPDMMRFWKVFDRLSQIFWSAVDRGIKLPMQNLSDIHNNFSAIGASNVFLARYLFSSLGSQIDRFNLRSNKALIGLLSMMTEDTLHTRTIDDAPFINAALGCSIRGNIVRPHGGMYGFFTDLVEAYERMGGVIALKHKVTGISGRVHNYTVHTKRGDFAAKAVVSTIAPPALSAISSERIQQKLSKYIKRDETNLGAGILVTLGVPDSEVEGEEFTHHQLLQDYDSPLGNGNNMFISVSTHGDVLSAPKGYRAVMISTHTEIDDWKNLSKSGHKHKTSDVGETLLGYARRVYPTLGESALIYDVAGPQTYQRFARRPHGAVGGVRQTMRNSNQFALPQDIGVKGLYLAGDYTWPGVGTTSCVMGSKVVENCVMKVLS